MGASIEFYSADAQELSQTYDMESWDDMFEAQSIYPKADLGTHLWMPDDLDRLCQVLAQHIPDMPGRFEELVVSELWNDGDVNSARLWLLSPKIKAFASLDDVTMAQVAASWTEKLAGIVKDGPKALLELRNVCKHAVENQGPVLVYTCY